MGWKSQISPHGVCRFVILGNADGFCERCFCSADILKSMCAYSLTFPPPPCFVSCAAADIISTVEFNSSGELLATGDKGGRVVVFQREQEVGNTNNDTLNVLLLKGSIFKIFFLYCIKNTISLPNAI